VRIFVAIAPVLNAHRRLGAVGSSLGCADGASPNVQF